MINDVIFIEKYKDILKRTNNIIFGDLVHFASNFRVAFFKKKKIDLEKRVWGQ